MDAVGGEVGVGQEGGGHAPGCWQVLRSGGEVEGAYCVCVFGGGTGGGGGEQDWVPSAWLGVP